MTRVVLCYMSVKKTWGSKSPPNKEKKSSGILFSCVLFSSAYNSARKIFLLFNLQLTYNEEKKPVLLDPILFERNGQIH